MMRVICLKDKEHPATVELHSGSLWKRQDKSKWQFESIREVHGHQLWLQRRSNRRTYQQLPPGKGSLTSFYLWISPELTVDSCLVLYDDNAILLTRTWTRSRTSAKLIEFNLNSIILRPHVPRLKTVRLLQKSINLYKIILGVQYIVI